MSTSNRTLERLVHRMARRYRRYLHSTGKVCVQSGSLKWDRGYVHGHSDFGPDDLDKDRNEDFVLLWAPSPGAVQSPLQWAVAIADGVTSSYRGDLASELACWSGLSQIVRSSSDNLKDSIGRDSVAASSSALQTVGCRIRNNEERWRPHGEFLTAWKYRLDRGVFLQTTLTLAWCFENIVHTVRIGDGGAAVLPSNASRSNDSFRILWDVDNETHRVTALGPTNIIADEDIDRLQFSVTEGTTLAFYTDGIARVVSPEMASFFDDAMDSAAANLCREPAPEIVRKLKFNFADQTRDNLSIVLVTFNQS